jgi:tagaturonate reductase
LAQQPDLRFVISNTTENGIVFEPKDRFEDAPASSFPGKLARFLFERYQHFEGATDKGLIVLPCELIEDNATQLEHILLHYAEVWNLEAGFATWLRSSNRFCNTLVDRIVTGFPKTNAEGIWQELGFKDDLLLEGEAYHSWIIEAPDELKEALPSHKTSLSIQFTRNLALQREIKVRILNGAHTAMVSVAYLYGERTVDAVMRNDLLQSFIRDLVFLEVIPTLRGPQEELKRFANATLSRFKNPILKHQLSAISLNSTSKFKTRLLPSLLSYYDQTGQLPKRIVFALACLIRFYKGDWQGEKTPVNDAAYQELWQELWLLEPREQVAKKVLASITFWGQDLREVKGLTALVATYLEALEQDTLEQNTLLPLLEHFS